MTSESGLFRPTGAEWNYRDTAADCYPFYVWAAYFTDQQVLDTVMIDALEAEQRLCNHLDRIPVSYDMDAGPKIEMDFDAMIFGASEYAKDGLVPIVEITGRDYPWFQRMQEIVDDIFKHAPYETLRQDSLHERRGQRRPAADPAAAVFHDGRAEVSRLGAPPGRLLSVARRVRADAAVGPRLRDHRRTGPAVCGGPHGRSGEGATSTGPTWSTCSTRCCGAARIPTASSSATCRSTGPHDNVDDSATAGATISWVFSTTTWPWAPAATRGDPQADDESAQAALLKFNWDHGSRDNVADSVEGGLYLLRRFPVPEAFVWADREIATLLVDHADPERLWGVHKLEANTVRTVLIHTMLHTRNTIARPWQQGLQLGAAPCGEGICLFCNRDRPTRAGCSSTFRGTD